MSNKFFIILAVAMIALSTLACSFNGINISLNTETVKGSGNLETEVRELNQVTSVSLTSIGELTIILGDQEKLEIEAEDNFLPLITSEVKNGNLTLAIKDNVNIQPTESIRYTLYITEALDGLAVSGLGSIQAPEISTKNMRINVSGAGDIKIEQLTAEKLDCNISGLGSIYINQGEVTRQTTDISGSGKFDAEDLRSMQADITISGLGDANIWVEEQLTVEISGSGSVSYYGTPSVRQEISGIGSLNNKGEH